MSAAVTSLALAIWARQFAALISAGVSLMRAMDLLAQTSDPELAGVTRDMMARVESGEVLSKAMAEHPEVFNRLSISMCRAGEVGGILDDTFAAWADWLERDLDFRARLDTNYLLAQIGRYPVSREDYEAQLQAAMPDVDERVQEMVFCRLFGMMLGSGVPVLQSLDVACHEVYPGDGDERWELIRAAVTHEPPEESREAFIAALRQFGFSPFTVQLAAVGWECGTLDRMMDKAADLLDRELSTRLSAALAGMIGAGVDTAGA
jgi:type II secretory pathway component PulF